MAAEDEPKPEQTGTRFRQCTRTRGIGSPAYSKARRSARMTMCFELPSSSISSGIAPAPSPSVEMAKRAARSTVISFQMSRPMPMASKPGPMLAVVAGTRTTTLLRGHFCFVWDRTRFILGTGSGTPPYRSLDESWEENCSDIPLSLFTQHTGGGLATADQGRVTAELSANLYATCCTLQSTFMTSTPPARGRRVRRRRARGAATRTSRRRSASS
mmetsp:Transcript_22178/g.69429  ORF Transcript_22178/g.69429 Transcript_22178/m.69429 type:complete len:215 (-) Transcript_22178:2306-2950(-)